MSSNATPLGLTRLGLAAENGLTPELADQMTMILRKDT
jgi:hypothetical protein